MIQTKKEKKLYKQTKAFFPGGHAAGDSCDIKYFVSLKSWG